MKKTAFLFPGQGAQYPGMGKDFVETFQIAKHTFEEADDILGYKLSHIIFQGSSNLLTETKNSQTGIYVTSLAMLRVIENLFPNLKPFLCAGLSLGEYTAATASGYLLFKDGLSLVQKRGQYMNEACEANRGEMAVVLGLDANVVEKLVNEVNIPNDLWVANFNCPGQVVISGTKYGIEVGTALAKERGAKRVLSLSVHGAFHSGLMDSAREQLADHIKELKLNKKWANIVMNVTGKVPKDDDEFKRNLINQVTSPVRWEQGIKEIDKNGVELYLEIGPGKALTGFNKRIEVAGNTISIEKVEDLKFLEKAL
jgi:[acyl-carrier-protein] S-malonyltransferase